MKKLILYIATSVDGYIAQPNDDLSFLSTVQREGEDYGYGAFIDGIDTVILGRKTYEWVLRHAEYPHADKDSYVITRQARPSVGRIQFYTGDISSLVNELKNKPGKDIFCDGGAEIVHLLLKEGLVEEIILSIIPVLLGAGTPLFKEPRPYEGLQLLSSKAFESGLVQLHYQIKASQKLP
ncbi:dihydrofolate reductase [Dyadobacter jejuensis]|uniref:Dihydrofolate reductase n=1 Tax=Dyadobacter jejuensis TaxID=1082580 RepID=A0A316BCR8_9BACT|nr:dihydrofolate reductase family protein [Dyadobacter jejuensis]PWJ60257.1 dihydrofolate reductase [Dyadobacter jejuensis]